jgi:hypothetical protein
MAGSNVFYPGVQVQLKVYRPVAQVSSLVPPPGPAHAL